MRAGAESDLAAILALEEAFVVRERWSGASWAGELAAADRFVVVTGDPVSAVASVRHVGEVAELTRIIVAPSARRSGLGRGLLAAGIAAAAGVGCVEMMLEVRHDNAPALGLYQEFGFTELARRVNYYGGGVDAVVMRRELEVEDDG